MNTNVVRSVRIGGNWTNGANDGFGYANTNNAPSNGNANYGAGQPSSRFSFHKPGGRKKLNFQTKGRKLPVRSTPWFGNELKLPNWNRFSRRCSNNREGVKRKFMKRLGNLYGEFASKENVTAAFWDGIEHKLTHPDVRELWFDEYRNKPLNEKIENARSLIDPSKVDAFVDSIVHDLQNGTYRHGIPRYKPMFCTSLSKGGKGKWRPIYCPSLRDHTVHHAVMRVCMPAFTKGMYRWCVGSVPERGPKDVIKAVAKWCQTDKHWNYFVILDIKRFFDTIRYADEMKVLESKIKDKRILAIHSAILTSAPFAVVTGYYTSPWYSNLLLEPVDHFIMEKLYKVRRGKRIPYVRHMIRYADDILLLGSNKRDLEKSIRKIIQMLSDLYGLTVKPSWEIKRLAEYDENGKLKPGTYRINYVGYLFDRTRTILRDGNFLSTKRLSVKTRKSPTLKNCKSLVSKFGYAAHIDKAHFSKIINRNFSIDAAKEVISHAERHSVFGST